MSEHPREVPLADSPAEVEVIDSELVFEGRLLSVAKETFLYNGVALTREFIKHPGAVAVLVLDEQDRALVINQYRHPIRSREWEIPAGLLDVKDEPLLLAAQRELAEEADLEATEWSILADTATTPGGSNEFVRVFLARGLTATADVFERFDEEADIVIEWVSLDDLVAAIAAGSVRNSLLQVGVLSAYAARARGWQGLLPASR
jgi:ADP-ribose pyrophosphatase